MYISTGRRELTLSRASGYGLDTTDVSRTVIMSAMAYDVADMSELEAGGPGGMVRFVRKALGVTAFGINHFTIPPHTEGREHDHAADGQEEVYVVLAGAGVMVVDGEEVELRPGRFLRVDGASTRKPVSGADGLEFVTVGAVAGGGYEPPPWG
jgi:mannose-6-phosphate isomerase-like protein (cupin superfamily)